MFVSIFNFVIFVCVSFQNSIYRRQINNSQLKRQNHRIVKLSINSGNRPKGEFPFRLRNVQRINCEPPCKLNVRNLVNTTNLATIIGQSPEHAQFVDRIKEKTFFFLLFPIKNYERVRFNL